MADLNVIVSGDLTIDWHIARVKRPGYTASDWLFDSPLHIFQQKGGGVLLADLVSALASRLENKLGQKVKTFTPDIYNRASSVDPSDIRYHHTTSIWSQFKGKDKPVWRIEEYLGMTRAEVYDPADWLISPQDVKADLVLLSDLNLGFRDDRKAWPAAIHQTVPGWY